MHRVIQIHGFRSCTSCQYHLGDQEIASGSEYHQNRHLKHEQIMHEDPDYTRDHFEQNTWHEAGNAVSVFLDKLSECKWTTKEVMKGSQTSKAIVGFNYDDKMVGTIEMKLIKEEKVWKIDDLGLPKFDKLVL